MEFNYFVTVLIVWVENVHVALLTTASNIILKHRSEGYRYLSNIGNINWLLLPITFQTAHSN